MHIMSKSLNEYFAAAWKFLTVIFLITMIVVYLRLFSDFPTGIQSILTLGGVVFVGYAGWTAVRIRRFDLKHAAFVGFLSSFGSHWSVPIFHENWEILYIILINSIIFSIVACFGGWVAKKFRK